MELLFPGCVLDDATDDPYAPWFTAHFCNADVIIEFNPHEVQFRLCNGGWETSMTYQTYSTSAFVEYLMKLSGLGATPPWIH